jgi:hypothetical protein
MGPTAIVLKSFMPGISAVGTKDLAGLAASRGMQLFLVAFLLLLLLHVASKYFSSSAQICRQCSLRSWLRLYCSLGFARFDMFGMAPVMQPMTFWQQCRVPELNFSSHVAVTSGTTSTSTTTTTGPRPLSAPLLEPDLLLPDEAMNAGRVFRNHCIPRYCTCPSSDLSFLTTALGLVILKPTSSASSQK